VHKSRGSGELRPAVQGSLIPGRTTSTPSMPAVMAPVVVSAQGSASHRAEQAEPVGTLVPNKVGARQLNSERPLSPRLASNRDPAMPLDEDQYDIPTFLRRNGHTNDPA